MIAMGMAMVLVPVAALAQQSANSGDPLMGQQVAEEGSTSPVKYGVVFGAPGFVTDGYDSEATVYLGGGGEVIWPSGLGFGVDGGYMTSPSGFDYGVFVFSPGIIFEFPLEGSTRPYVRGGYTLMFRDGAANLFSFGGGVNHWFNERLGLKFEVRDNVYLESGGSPHFIDFLIGLNIRSGG